MCRVELARISVALRARLNRAPISFVLAACLALAACAGGLSSSDFVSSQPGAPEQQAANAIGQGQVKVGLILPLGAPGNAGATAQSMRNAAELALGEFNDPNIQLLVKDDGGSAPGAQQAAQQLIEEGAEIILGPLFAHSVAPVGQVARARGIPVVAFSTDSNVAAAGVYLLSFLPESDVERLVGYAAQQGKRSFAAAVPDNAYGTVVEAAFKQAVGRRNGRIVAFERYPADRNQLQAAIRSLAAGARTADAIFIPDTADTVPTIIQTLGANGVDTRTVQLLGSGLWEDPQIFSTSVLEGAWYAGPDATGFRNFSGRYRTRYNQDPVRTATLVYDAVALVAALTKTQGERRFSADVLTNTSGFNGIDGLFRFRRDGVNQRGLAVMKVTPTGGQVISPSPRSFGGSGT
jgi:branched-chain amino acid transport system substrate-binding protein